MTNDEFKKLKELIRSEVRPVKETTEILGKRVREIGVQQTLTLGLVRTMKDLQSVMNEKLDEHDAKLDEHGEKLDSLVLAVAEVQDRTKILGDIHSLVQDNTRRSEDLESRVDNLEPRVSALEAVVAKRSS